MIVVVPYKDFILSLIICGIVWGIIKHRNWIKNNVNEVLQWVGAAFISAGHVLNTMGSTYHRDFWNIAAFAVGTFAFFIWTVRVANKPQMAVNAVGLTAIAVGLFKAWS